ncbi:bifunctional alpha,alpha-trehalose-phosphate synthase (UDP-forming)/trehalose-phosphatase [Paraflavitalea sp. CAU 1676]|uniref:bifunctional alpha,alpha-trehalose-phosphate synthase (UDP-forming)/trehalose-phosphatase n=1 Tax=Paraflavitalea sp. CAU 1676 TaxID=3032598 RepID=UPI0023DA7F43|nr:bifunctional alpha,alpha-trehalose-phosphate synthase (UDP-forming)/trehalose-phosphatase [Paraflavitalea sp. CAU 1676]MDF2192067.1 bifunctional alpha,alpha-trehalose-phosphate synthase (UDP-forming)/trehalose-phosphatase [Paraflavitalea sp. CAU 1676]
MGRLFIVSNRLPFSVDRDGEQVTIRQSSGGLVSAIKSYFESDAAATGNFEAKMWMGVADFSNEDWTAEVEPRLKKYDFTAYPLFIDKTVYKDYYNGFANSVLWPLFHYFPSLVDYQTNYYDAFVQVNKAFANRLAEVVKPGDTVWIHDYQLMLLPEMLRAVQPEVNIGFFLHIPFPSYEILRLMPAEWKTALLRGLLGADLIGFHTHDYVQHFMQSVKMLLGVDNYFYTMQYQDRLVKADLFPIGIDYKRFHNAAYDTDVLDLRNDIKRNFENKKIIFSVDRLDYTKGLMDRLNGFEYFLQQHPVWQEKLVFVLNIVPSRDEIPAYLERKKQIEEKIGTLNGKFSTISWQPVIYRYNHLPFNELCALYQAADIALITPLRDGMNLVAKEYVASCSTQRGVLILSELAGAASELNEALLVNPTDVVDVSNAIEKALHMPSHEQKNRMALMQKRLADYDVVKWVNDFLDQLVSVRKEQIKMQTKLLDEKIYKRIHQHYQKAQKRCLLLDYDGTLVSFARLPQEAVPSKELKELLYKLGSDERNHVVIISGRDAEVLEKWLGHLPLTLVAEHGASYKMKGESWQQAIPSSDQWKEVIRPIMQIFVSRCVGSFVEEKNNTIAWHYRNTAADLGFSRSRELINNLSQMVQNTMLQVIDGNKVIEVRMSGFDKGVMALRIVNDLSPDFTLCIGDDTTDEDMFKALGSKAYSIKVSNGITAAQYTVFSQRKVLPLLEQLLTPLTEREYAGA